jgi:adenosylhomocysteine nucleosidase
MNDAPIVILTALNLEYIAVRAKLSDIRVERHPTGTRFEVGNLGDPDRLVALALVGKGNHPAAVLTERAIAEFNPRAVLFVGVAGALWPHVGLGDVVVATHVYAYHGGTSQDDGLKGRPRVWEISHGPDQIARHLDRDGGWRHQLPLGSVPPKIHFGPIAAGETVQDSAISEQAQWIREHYNDALAIEMEAAGVAQAGQLNNSLPVIIIRGISDRADGSKAATDGAQWQQKAVANAAAFAVAFAEELALSSHNPSPRRAREIDRSTDMGGASTNIASGNARVAVQAGQIFGGVRIGPQTELPADLAAQLAEFREQLGQAARAGHIDEAVRQAAEMELDIAADALATDTAQGQTKLMVALKRLSGLISDVAALAA